jgi:hypothetical protein
LLKVAEAEQQTGGQSSSQGNSQAQATGTSAQGNTSGTTQTSQNDKGSQATEATQQTAQLAARPEYVPENFWDTTGGKIKDDKAFGSWINEHVAFKAADDSRKLSLPQNADAYKVELPADFKPPEGIDFKFKSDDPLLSQARTMAHKMGISQESFSSLLGLYAGGQVATQQQIQAARTAEVAKLGTTGPARVAAVTTWAKAILGDAGGAQFAARMFTAGDVENVEKLITRFGSQGSGAFRTTGREADVAGRLPDGEAGEKQWSSMTYSQRKEYAEKFPQSNGAA